MAKSRDEVICFGKSRGLLSDYRCRKVNGEYAVIWGEPVFDMKQRTFTCPNEIEGHPIIGVYEAEGDSLAVARFRVLFIDCNLQIFKINKRSFDCLKTIILGEHFSATEDMIKSMILNLQEMNPSLRKKFPKVMYWDGRELNVSNYLNVQSEFVVTVQFDKKGNQKANYRTSDKNIQVGSIVMVEGNNFYARAGAHYEDIEAVVCEINTKFNGFVEKLKPIKSVVSYRSTFVPNDLSNFLDAHELSDGAVVLKRKGRGNKFKELVLPNFEGRKVIIAENGFENCNIGTMTFECDVIGVGKNAFSGATIKKIKNYKKVNYQNVKDDVLRLNILKFALKDYKPGDKKNYLTETILQKDLISLIESSSNRSVFNSEDEIDVTMDRIHAKNLTSFIDFESSNKKMFVLNNICCQNALFMKQIVNGSILSFVSNNYEKILKEIGENATTLLIRKDLYQPWSNFPSCDYEICKIIYELFAVEFSGFNYLFSNSYYHYVPYSDYASETFVNDCLTVIERCKKNNFNINFGFNFDTGKSWTLDDLAKCLNRFSKNCV